MCTNCAFNLQFRPCGSWKEKTLAPMESKTDSYFLSQVDPIWVIECVSLYVMTGNTIITFLTSSGLNWENKPKTNYIILNGLFTLKSLLDYVKGVSLLLGKEALCFHPLVVDDLVRSFLSRHPHFSLQFSGIHWCPFLQFLQQSWLPSTSETAGMLQPSSCHILPVPYPATG